MWNPGFPFIRSTPALLRGYHRAFCIYSVRYRGTPARPGLVLGLDRGGACRGIAFLVAEADVSDVVRLLWAREMPRFVYRPRIVPIHVETGRALALTFLSNTAQESYAGALTFDEVVSTIAECEGVRGRNSDYLIKTLRHLQECGVRDPRLQQLAEAVEARTGERESTG
jgi:cation transport protein ChaC